MRTSPGGNAPKGQSTTLLVADRHSAQIQGRDDFSFCAEACCTWSRRGHSVGAASALMPTPGPGKRFVLPPGCRDKSRHAPLSAHPTGLVPVAAYCGRGILRVRPSTNSVGGSVPRSRDRFTSRQAAA